MSGDVHVRFCESVRVRFPRATHLVVMCRDFNEAKAAYQRAKDILEGDLHLKMHDLDPSGKGKTNILRVTQWKFKFLGVRFNGNRMWPSEERQQKFFLKLRQATDFNPTRNLLEVLQDTKWLVEGWISAYCHTDLSPLLPLIEKAARERLGHCGFKMGWLSERQDLSDTQFKFSGLPNLTDYLDRQRERLARDKKYNVFESLYSDESEVKEKPEMAVVI